MAGYDRDELEKVDEKWKKFSVICCLVAIFLDPLFFLLLSVQQDNKCIAINWPMTKTIVVLRSLTDFMYLLTILRKFWRRLRTAQNYGFLKYVDLVDLFVVLPLPQIMVLLVLPVSLGSSGVNYATNLILAAVLIQYIPRLFRFIPAVFVGRSPSGLIFERAWANFFINLFTFVLSGHVIGSCWYLFGLQRVNQCLRGACNYIGFRNTCLRFIDCGDGNAGSDLNWKIWTKNKNATACFSGDSFEYGIYKPAVKLTSENIITRYVFSLFWGIQQISTLAGNQQPSDFVWEVLFTMLIIGVGLLLFAFVIGNMQSFLQALGRSMQEFLLRQRDVKQWMSSQRWPHKLRRRVLKAERCKWAANRGVDEEKLTGDLSEDLLRDIRRHRFKFVKTVSLFASMDEHLLDAICERLIRKIYMKEEKKFKPGDVVDKMVFIVRGKLESIGHDGTRKKLREGSICGDELLTWLSKDGKKIKVTGQRLPSKKEVRFQFEKQTL